MNFIPKNIELGKSTFFHYRKNDKTPTIKFSDLIKLSQMQAVDSVENTVDSVETENVGFENTPINRFRTAVLKIKNIRNHSNF